MKRRIVTVGSPGKKKVAAGGKKQSGAIEFHEGIEGENAAELPAPVPGTDPAIVTGLPDLSCPVVMSRACRRWKKFPFSLVSTRT